MRYWFLLAILVIGCTSTGDTTLANGLTTIRLVVSTDLGGQILFDKTVSGTGDVITILGQHTETETTYGGKFVDSINGVRTKPDYAWFYYVNGELMGIGAASYTPENNDIIQWDYHYYSDNPFDPPVLAPPVVAPPT